MTSREPSRAVLRHLAYPLLLAAVVLTVVLSIHFQLDLTLVNFLFLLGNFAYLALLERLIPFEISWQTEPREWVRDCVYWLLTMLSGAVAMTVLVGIAQWLAPLHGALPLWVEIPLAMLLSSLGGYLFHRLGHSHPWFWRVHGIHHLPAKVNVSNNNVNHVIDVLGRLIFANLPMWLLGLSRQGIFAAAIFNTAQGYFVHANVDVRLGWLNYLVGTPEQHRLHHSTDLREAGHYSVDLTFWDLVFRTFTWSPGRRPAEVGVRNPSAFPPTDAILFSQAHPFRPTESDDHPHS